jgi:murein L,D-transpeptidase YcbB/YkuD
MKSPVRVALFCALSLTLAHPAPGWAAEPSQVSEAGLNAAVTDPLARAFYTRQGWKPLWNDRREEQLVAALGDARRHGMDGARFVSPIEAASTPAAREAALTQAALAYARALRFGLVDPDKVNGLYTLERPTGDVIAGLTQAVKSGDIARWLDSLAPQDAEYRALSDAYLQSISADAVAREAIPAGAVLRPGAKDPRIPAIAKALGVSTAKSKTLYTPELEAAVRAFQADKGLQPDGIIGADTLRAMNGGAGDHARQLAVNLERRRWLARDPAARRIDVNTAAAFLTYWRGNAEAHRARVVVGKSSTPTPALGSMMTRLVVNPPWYVPTSIAQKEIFPKGSGYMRAQNMYVQDGRIIQRPGPKAALGEVKFDLDNPYAIYLHDTPSKALFERDERHASHGCVRVHNALDFARMLATEDGNGAVFEERLATKKTGTVNLGNPIPVRLLYHTAYLDTSGRITYATDAYGWDETLAKALGMAGKGARAAAPVAADVGP